jgi:hypothetical protein
MGQAFIPILIIGGVILFVVGIIAAVAYYERKRREGLETVATELGLTFLPEGDPAIQEQVNGFGLFNQGRSRQITNLIKGTTDEVEIAIFDYRYVTGSGKHQTTHNQTVASLRSHLLNVPSFAMRPEGMFDKIGSVLGYQDIDFESHPEFSQMFVLKSDNEQQVREFFGPEILEFFETQRGISVEARAGALIFYRPRSRATPDQIKDLLSQAYGVFGVMVDSKKD